MTTTAAHLDDYVETADHDGLDDAPDDAFTIETEETAAWATDKLLSYAERIARLDAQHEEMHRRLVADRDRFAALVLPELERYARLHPPAKGKTLHLLTGSLSLRIVRGGPRIVDKDATLAWAQEHLPSAVVVPTPAPRVDADTIKAHVLETGEVPPGVDLVEDREAFDVKGPKGKV